MLTARAFDDPDEAVAEAAKQLAAKNSDFDRLVLVHLVEKVGAVERIDAPSSAGELVPSGMHPALAGRYVIRDDLLLSIENFMALLKSAGNLLSGVLSLPTPAGWKGTADGLHSLYETFSKIAARAWRLSDEELAVVLALRSLGPSSTDAVVKKVSGIDAIRAEEVLARFERRDNNPSGFVLRTSDGVWRLEGV